jgi:hypothetical protein
VWTHFDLRYFLQHGLSLILLVIAGRTKTDDTILKQLKELPMIFIMIMMVRMISSVLSLDGLVSGGKFVLLVMSIMINLSTCSHRKEHSESTCRDK